jgi:hypothetical protein
MFEPRSERQGPGGKGGASGNPEIDQIIMQFLQSMSTGGMMGGLPMMNNPPMPPSMGQGGPNRTQYPNKMQQQNRPPQQNPGMYGQRPQQPGNAMGSYPGAGFNQNMMGGAPAPNQMPMMNQGFKENFAQPNKMMPTGPMPGNMMPQSMPIPPINAISEDSMYNQAYSELVNTPDYLNSDDDDRRNKIGDLIYQYVERKSGVDNAPKITGMIIDLELPDLEASTATMQSLNEKINEGMTLLVEEN